MKSLPLAIVGRRACGCLAFFTVELHNGRATNVQMIYEHILAGITMTPMSIGEAHKLIDSACLYCRTCRPDFFRAPPAEVKTR